MRTTSAHDAPASMVARAVKARLMTSMRLVTPTRATARAVKMGSTPGRGASLHGSVWCWSSTYPPDSKREHQQHQQQQQQQQHQCHWGDGVLEGVPWHSCPPPRQKDPDRQGCGGNLGTPNPWPRTQEGSKRGGPSTWRCGPPRGASGPALHRSTWADLHRPAPTCTDLHRPAPTCTSRPLHQSQGHAGRSRAAAPDDVAAVARS